MAHYASKCVECDEKTKISIKTSMLDEDGK